MEITLLGEIELFKYMNSKELELISKIGKSVFFEKGDIVFKEKDKSDFFYIIKEGKVEVYLERGDNVIIITHLGKGSFFGEIGFFTGSLRTASIMVEEPTELIMYSQEDLVPLLEEYPEIGYKFFKALTESLARRIVLSNENLETLFFINKALVDNEKFRNLFISFNKDRRMAPSSNG